MQWYIDYSASSQWTSMTISGPDLAFDDTYHSACRVQVDTYLNRRRPCPLVAAYLSRETPTSRVLGKLIRLLWNYVQRRSSSFFLILVHVLSVMAFEKIAADKYAEAFRNATGRLIRLIIATYNLTTAIFSTKNCPVSPLAVKSCRSPMNFLQRPFI